MGMRFVYTYEDKYTPKGCCPPNSTIEQQAVDSDDGKYDMYYVPKFRGLHSLHVLLFGRHIAGSPYRVGVMPGDIDPLSCWAWDTVKVDTTKKGGLKEGRAGRTYSFKITCNDEFGNSLKGIALPAGRTATFTAKFEDYASSSLYWGSVSDDCAGCTRDSSSAALEKMGDFT